MSGAGWLAIATGALLDGGLKATVVLLAGAGLGAALRHESASTRHGVYAATLLTLPLLPLAALGRGPELAVDRPEVFAVWLVGLVLCALPLTLGRYRLGRAWSRAHPSELGPTVRISHEVQTPLMFGWAHPRILLPRASLRWDAERLDAVLAHERGHIHRRDWLVHAASWMVCAAFWFHPGAWFLRRRVMREAEHAADDAALARGTAPTDYAQILVDMARDYAPAAALAHSPSELERRVLAVLSPRRRTGRGALPLVFLGTALALTPLLAAWPAWTAPPSAQVCEPVDYSR